MTERRSPKTTGWQPMSTAPRDGSEVLGWARVGWIEGGGLATAGDERRRVVMHWSAFTRQIDIEEVGEEGEWLLESATPYGEVADPALWSPLLEEPAHVG